MNEYYYITPNNAIEASRRGPRGWAYSGAGDSGELVSISTGAVRLSVV